MDIALEADGHCIKRTVPIRDGKMDPTGVVYIGEGGYGAPQRDTKDLWYLESPGFVSRADHLMIFDYQVETVEYKTIGIDGSSIDQQTFNRRDR